MALLLTWYNKFPERFTALTNPALPFPSVGLSAVVVACVGGGAIVIAIAAYYTYFVKKPAETTTSGRELEEAAPVVAPAATLGYKP